MIKMNNFIFEGKHKLKNKDKSKGQLLDELVKLR